MVQGGGSVRRPARGASRAFTILELLVGLVVVASGIMAVLTTMTQAMRSLREHNQALLAKSAVKRQMEWLHTRTFAQVVSQAFPDVAPADGIGDGLELLPGAIGAIAVCHYDPTANPAACTGPVNQNTTMKQVTVTVTLNTNRSFRASTLLSQ